MANVSPAPAPATSASAAAARACKTRTGIFIYDLVVVAILVVLALAYINNWWFDWSAVPEPYKDPVRLTIQAMWFGALGGIVISLKGIYDHTCLPGDWDDGFCIWHIGRPISAAITGLITMVLLKAVNPGQPLTEPVVYTVAFIFGTQERRFFNFLSEVAALVVKVPNEDQDNTLKATGIQPPEGPAGALVIIGGQGFAQNAAVTFGNTAVANPVVSKDGRTVACVVPAGSGAVDVAVTNPDSKRVVLADKFTYKS